jgi:glycosyltransferase involved in cell wall biosynthesis
MKVLFVTHTGAWSGAEGHLLLLINGLRRDHEIAVACPPRHRLADELDRIGVRRFDLPSVEASFRLDPIQTPRGLAAMAVAAAALRYAVWRFQPDVTHSWTVRAGLVAALAGVHGHPPLVVQVHDHLPGTRVGHAVRRLVARSADQVVTVSRFTADRFNEGLPRPEAYCVYNGLDRERFDPSVIGPAPLRAQMSLPETAALLGVVGQITPWKGQDTAIRALAELRESGADAHLLIVGQVVFTGRQVRYDNDAFLRELQRLTSTLGVKDSVHFLGQRPDVPALLRALDLLLVPSWDEPFASVVMESAAMRTPALIGSASGAAEVLRHGVSAMILPSSQPELWADAARELLRDEPARARMGEQARAVAAQFSNKRHRQEMLAVYARALSATVDGGEASTGRG